MKRGDDERAAARVPPEQRRVARPRANARAGSAPLQLDFVEAGVDFGVKHSVELALHSAGSAHWTRVRARLAVRHPVHHDARRDVVAEHAGARAEQRVSARDLRGVGDEKQRVGRCDRRGICEREIRRHRRHVRPAADAAERRRFQREACQRAARRIALAVLGRPNERPRADRDGLGRIDRASGTQLRQRYAEAQGERHSAPPRRLHLLHHPSVATK